MIRKSTNHNHYGVSGVVGTILMIAVTITLAAAVATYGFDLAEELLVQPPQAGVSLDQEYNTFNDTYIVSAVLNSAPNASYIELRGNVQTDSSSNCEQALNDSNIEYDDPVERTSEVGTVAYVCASSGTTVRAVAVTDGGEQVISSYTVNE